MPSRGSTRAVGRCWAQGAPDDDGRRGHRRRRHIRASTIVPERPSDTATDVDTSCSADRKVRAVRPRARTTDDREVDFGTYGAFQDPDLLDGMAFERMVAGLSTRHYDISLEPVGEVDCGTSKAAALRRFVTQTSKALAHLMSQELHERRRLPVAALRSRCAAR